MSIFFIFPCFCFLKISCSINPFNHRSGKPSPSTQTRKFAPSRLPHSAANLRKYQHATKRRSTSLTRQGPRLACLEHQSAVTRREDPMASIQFIQTSRKVSVQALISKIASGQQNHQIHTKSNTIHHATRACTARKDAPIHE